MTTPATAWLLGMTATALVLASARPRPVRPPSRAAGRPVAPDLRARGTEILDRVLPGRRTARRDRQLPDALDRLGASLRAGDAIGPALVALAPAVADPLGGELQGVGRSIEHGGGVAEALARWAGAPHSSRDVRLVAAALTVGAGSGGEVARAVDGVAATLRERHEVAAEAHALATQARSSAALLVVAPLAFAGLVATVEPGAVAFLVTTPIGLACLLLGIALDVVGALWMARIVRSTG